MSRHSHPYVALMVEPGGLTYPVLRSRGGGLRYVRGADRPELEKWRHPPAGTVVLPDSEFRVGRVLRELPPEPVRPRVKAAAARWGCRIFDVADGRPLLVEPLSNLVHDRFEHSSRAAPGGIGCALPPRPVVYPTLTGPAAAWLREAAAALAEAVAVPRRPVVLDALPTDETVVRDRPAPSVSVETPDAPEPPTAGTFLAARRLGGAIRAVCDGPGDVRDTAAAAFAAAAVSGSGTPLALAVAGTFDPADPAAGPFPAAVTDGPAAHGFLAVPAPWCGRVALCRLAGAAGPG